DSRSCEWRDRAPRIFVAPHCADVREPPCAETPTYPWSASVPRAWAGWRDRTPAEPPLRWRVRRRRPRQRERHTQAVGRSACAATIGRESPCRPRPEHSCATCSFYGATIPWPTRTVAVCAIALALMKHPLDMKLIDKGGDPGRDLRRHRNRADNVATAFEDRLP